MIPQIDDSHCDCVGKCISKNDSHLNCDSEKEPVETTLSGPLPYFSPLPEETLTIEEIEASFRPLKTGPYHYEGHVTNNITEVIGLMENNGGKQMALVIREWQKVETGINKLLALVKRRKAAMMK